MRWCAVAGIVAALGLLAPPATADDPVVYTGCIQKSDGSLYSVREGTTPTLPCKSKDKQISWNMAGQPGPEGPPGPALPRFYGAVVNCDEGESINDALATQAEQLHITIHGTCNEAVGINRDHVILQGSGDAGNPPTLTHEYNAVIARGSDIALHDLRIVGSGGGNGIWVFSHSDVALEDCDVSSPGATGVLSDGRSDTLLRNSRIHDSGTGVIVQSGGHLMIRNSHIDGNVWGIHSISSFLNISHSTISDNDGRGIILAMGSSGELNESDVSGNGETGIDMLNGSSIQVAATTIARNQRNGISSRGSSSVHVPGGATVIDNGGSGIAIESGSSLDILGSSAISGNHGAGIDASLSSFWLGADSMDLSGNGWGGIHCEQSEGVCDSTRVIGSISGCGPRCPNKP